jgi:hypothetical protein
MYLRLLVVFLPLVFATDIVFELERSTMIAAPCILGYVEGYPATSSRAHEQMNETIPDRCFDIETHRSDVFLQFTNRDGYIRDIQLFGMGGNRVRIDRSGAEPPTDWRQFSDRLGVSLTSDFGRAVGSMLLLPPTGSTTSHRMIIRPQDPSAFCVDRQLVMVDAFEGDQYYHDFVEVGISFIHEIPNENESSDPVPFVTNSTYAFGIETSEVMTMIPERVWEELIRVARNIGMVFVTDFYELEVGCADRIRLLPTIRFQIGYNVNIHLSPSEYLSVDAETGRCEWKICGFDHGYRLGSNLLAEVGLYYDYAENRIGFCDPL